MYYIYEGDQYNNAEVRFDGSIIELCVPQSSNTRATAYYLMFGLLGSLISSNTSKRVVSHRIMLSKDLTIHKNGCNSIYLSPPDDHVFELFDVDPDTAAKLLSLNRYQGVIFKEGINSKLKQEFAKRLSKEEPLSDNPVTDRKYEKVVYIKVKTRTDIPEGAKYDDQTGGKIVYVIEDED